MTTLRYNLPFLLALLSFFRNVKLTWYVYSPPCSLDLKLIILLRYEQLIKIKKCNMLTIKFKICKVTACFWCGVCQISFVSSGLSFMHEQTILQSKVNIKSNTTWNVVLLISFNAYVFLKIYKFGQKPCKNLIYFEKMSYTFAYFIICLHICSQIFVLYSYIILVKW